MCGRYTLAVELDELAERFGCATVVPVLLPGKKCGHPLGFIYFWFKNQRKSIKSVLICVLNSERMRTSVVP